ncbi:MAG: hypothetical protein J5779_00290 [Clostridia bacterium]|nr:hypothetical protein [Clostridia bacterium]
MNKNLKTILLILGITFLATGLIVVMVGFGHFQITLFMSGGILFFIGGTILAVSQSYRFKNDFDDEIKTLKQKVDFDKETEDKNVEEIPAGAKCKNCGATLKSSICDYCGAVNKKEK